MALTCGIPPKTPVQAARRLYEQIVELHSTRKLTCRQIADEINVSKSTVARYLVQWRKRVPIGEIRGNGRPSKITPKLRSYLGQAARRISVPTSRRIQAALSRERGVQISPRGLRNHLRDMDYKCSTPARVPKLNETQRQARVTWCREHRNYDWNKVIVCALHGNQVHFSDETYLEVGTSSMRIWHKNGCRPTAAKMAHPPKIMCWGEISSSSRSQLVATTGTMNATKYIDVLKDHLLGRYSKWALSRLVFQQDNARPHTAQITKDFFSSRRIAVLAWPANSPDLNPIENIWAILKSKLETRQPHTIEELKRYANEEWSNIPQLVFKNVIESMPERVKQVLERGGAKCDY
jgi:transposase